jgi:hypothetical protein
MRTDFLLLSLIVGSTASWAQLPTGECTFQTTCGAPWITYCGSTTNWADTVDLDGDGHPDFLHMSVVRDKLCLLAPEDFHDFRSTTDTAEGLFPQDGVEMYLLDHPDVPPILALLEPIELDGSLPFLHGLQPVRWVWNPTYPPNSVRHSGLGIVQHTIDGGPCSQPPYGPHCSTTTREGWLRAQNPALFGFRISKPDGWHLGWFKLEELATPITRPDGKKSSVILVDYAVHPDPDTEIRAGKKARPVLKAQISGGNTLLSWSTNWPGWRLSWSPTLNPVAWAPVEGVATNTNRVTLATTNTSGFFRLQETP